MGIYKTMAIYKTMTIYKTVVIYKTMPIYKIMGIYKTVVIYKTVAIYKIVAIYKTGHLQNKFNMYKISNGKWLIAVLQYLLIITITNKTTYIKNFMLTKQYSY